MSKAKRRRRWTAEKKLKIVLETLQSDQKLAEICRREGISPTQVYQWRRQLSASAEAIFGRKQVSGEDRRVAELATESQRMKNVIAEITAENLDLKKTLSD
jgi:transposase